MDENEFWKKALLGSYADDCIWHCIIPTILVTVTGSWDKLKEYIEEDNEPDIFIGRRLNLQCVLCKDQVLEKDTRLALRCLIGKREAKRVPDDGNKYYAYRCKINPTNICMKCDKKNAFTHSLNSNSEMIDLVLDDLDVIATNVMIFNMHKNLTGEQLWNIISYSFDANHKSRMMKLGKMDSKCLVCKNKTPTMFCSGCNYAMYCNETCSHKDWTKHKHECKILKNTSLINKQFILKF